MLFLQTDRGVVRSQDGAFVLVTTDITDLDAAVKEGALGSLATAPAGETVRMDELTVLPPVQPEQFVIAGLNYRAHCAEIGVAVPERLVFGFAPGSAVSTTGRDIVRPDAATDEVDYEGEIGVVIGAPAHEVKASSAWQVVAGIVPLNDVSARDVQAQGGLAAVAEAKGFPGFKPIGPCLATLDHFADPLDIGLETWVNDERRQVGRSADMVFNLPTIIETVTAKVALAPGDIICTGTPGGVAHGGKYPYLKSGDVVEVRVEGLPVLRNVVV